MKKNRPSGQYDRPARSYAADEVKAYGLNCCRAIFMNRPLDIIKVYFNDQRKHALGELLSWCSQNRRAYKLVSDDELEKIADTRHHEGICCIVRMRKAPAIDDVLARCRGGDPACLLLLEDVENPHNLGAILRTAAHFKVMAVLVAGEKGAVLSGAAMRVAEGGAEYVPLVDIGDDLAALQKLKRSGFVFIGTSSHARTHLYEAELPQRVVIMMGSERSGLSKNLMRMMDLEVNIPGSGFVESLNVGSAASVVLSEYFRIHQSGGAKNSRDRREAPPASRPRTNAHNKGQRREGGRKGSSRSR